MFWLISVHFERFLLKPRKFTKDQKEFHTNYLFAKFNAFSTISNCKFSWKTKPFKNSLRFLSVRVMFRHYKEITQMGEGEVPQLPAVTKQGRSFTKIKVMNRDGSSFQGILSQLGTVLQEYKVILFLSDGLGHFYRPHPKDGEGIVFTGVCPSTPGGGEGAFHLHPIILPLVHVLSGVPQWLVPCPFLGIPHCLYCKVTSSFLFLFNPLLWSHSMTGKGPKLLLIL